MRYISIYISKFTNMCVSLPKTPADHEITRKARQAFLCSKIKLKLYRPRTERWVLGGQRREKLQKLGMASSRWESLIHIEAQHQVSHQPPSLLINKNIYIIIILGHFQVSIRQSTQHIKFYTWRKSTSTIKK